MRFGSKFLLFFYRVFSDFGQNYIYPIFLLTGFFIASLALNHMIILADDGAVYKDLSPAFFSYDRFSELLKIASSGLFILAASPSYEEILGLQALVLTLHKLISTGLWVLFGFAIKNRFRMNS